MTTHRGTETLRSQAQILGASVPRCVESPFVTFDLFVNFVVKGGT